MTLPCRRLVLALFTGALLAAASPALAGHRTGARTRVNLTVKNADIRDVLPFLAREAGVNLVMTPSVSGRVTVALEDVPVGLAMEVILRVGGYVSVRWHGILVVMARGEESRFW